MKHYFTLIALFIGSVALAQPSGPEFTEVETDPIERSETTLQQQSFEAMMVSAFKTGNAAKIAKYFNDNVDLSIDVNEDVYSKSQAEQILKKFFATYSSKDFKIVHKVTSGQSEYFLGELMADKLYRVILNSKTDGGVKKITSLTISPN